ncbi:uncharacterized protein A1O5_04327 [Cladophialophora psammophila CBS 110553]|uniref:Cytochrome P450 oxidoreductase n=1 Tax=Cladophialophora psammophila CBS 110553 TaxID=1182543 RepID=W9X4G3_9EURO|nr:uncharacterized protein A1O5_04327 [Cladophialophora psammophila CBS 110553]EXJ71826.1 hypothetical protein A1O5_04327 [Cladophialophora psammophila CBS 110553]
MSALPPGPKGYPLIGNLLDMTDPDKVPGNVQAWAKEYGEIVHTKIGTANYIWLNSPTVVKELMDRRGSKYSSKPVQPMAFDCVSDKRRQIFMPYGEKWRNIRKISHAALNLRTSESYTPIQDFESKQVMYEYLHRKDDWEFYNINRRYSNSLIMTITYGHRVADWDDPVIKKIFTVLDHFVQMSSPGVWIVDSLPSLRVLPQFLLQNWWKTGRKWFEYDSKVYLDLYRGLVQQVKNGTAPECFVKDFYLSNPEKNGVDELDSAYAAGSMVEAGSESTSSVINSWILACLLNPHVVKAAQEELDRVIGSDRVPTFEDEANLPYIRAMVKETLRWRPITKVGAVHSTSEDDYYKGYYIPKGSFVVLNWWAIQFDRQHWQDPEAFEPLRYINDPLSTAECVNASDPNDRDHYAYGAGRRICTGLHVAQNSLFINMARTLWAFNLKKAVDAQGKVIEPSTETEKGFLCVPVKFPCNIEPRSQKHADIVERSWKEAEAAGLTWSRKKMTL